MDKKTRTQICSIYEQPVADMLIVLIDAENYLEITKDNKKVINYIQNLYNIIPCGHDCVSEYYYGTYRYITEFLLKYINWVYEDPSEFINNYDNFLDVFKKAIFIFKCAHNPIYINILYSSGNLGTYCTKLYTISKFNERYNIMDQPEGVDQWDDRDRKLILKEKYKLDKEIFDIK